MGELGEALQAEKAASPLDSVDQPEDGVEHLGIFGLLLETHELEVDDVKALSGLGEEFA